MPVDPGPCRWDLPAADDADEHGVVGVGADLEPATLLAAYRSGLFPMPIDRGEQIAWWSPDPRGILPLERLRVTRSLRQSARRYEIRVDTAFRDLMTLCADPNRRHGWITPAFVDAYSRLHEMGWAHSVEAWTPDGELAGGLYGVGIGGFFAGESMVSRRRDASKVALLALVDVLRSGGVALLDVQWCTGHLATLGAVEIPRSDYLRQLVRAVALPVDAWRSLS